MEELRITDISIKDVEFSIDEAIDFKISIDDFESPRKKYLFNWNEVSEYLFSWDEIPGTDDQRLIEFLKDELKIKWAKTENISKIDDDKTIIVSNKEKSISLKLNDEKTKVNLKIDDGSFDEFIVKTENGKLNIYVSENYYFGFINLLANKFDIEWNKKSGIEKINNDTMRVFTPENDLLLRLNDEKTEVSLIMGDVEIDKFVAKNEKGNVNIYDDLFKSYKENPDELLSQSPNQKISVSLKNNLPFELGDDYIELLESVYDELGFKDQIIKITSLRNIDSRTYKCEIYIRVDMAEKKDQNVKISDEFEELILLKGFQAITTHGKTFYSDISTHSLNFTPKKMDLRIITKLFGKDHVTYICFSDLIYRKFIEVINEDEYQSVQIDISDYVTEIEHVLDKQPFMKLCTNQYKSVINNEMRNMRSQNYRGVAKLWDAIENILSKIAKDSGYSGTLWSLNKRVEYLSPSTNIHKILSEETKSLIKALARDQQAHGKLNRPDHDHKYFAILWMKAIRDIYLDWCHFQSIDLCFAEMASDLDLQIDEVREIYGKRRKDRQHKEKKITIAEYPIGIDCAEDWESEIGIQLQFENQDPKQQINFNFNVNLINESLISWNKEILL